MERFLMDNTPKEKVEYLREFIKFKAATRGMNLTQMMAKVSKIYKRKPEVNNYSGKISRGTLSILELFEIFDILGIDVKFEDRN